VIVVMNDEGCGGMQETDHRRLSPGHLPAALFIHDHVSVTLFDFFWFSNQSGGSKKCRLQRYVRTLLVLHPSLVYRDQIKPKSHFNHQGSLPI
jgi:hypothetical protein